MTFLRSSVTRNDWPDDGNASSIRPNSVLKYASWEAKSSSAVSEPSILCTRQSWPQMSVWTSSGRLSILYLAHSARRLFKLLE